MCMEEADKLTIQDLLLEDLHIGVEIQEQDTHKVEIFHTTINNILHLEVVVLVDTSVGLGVLMEETV